MDQSATLPVDFLLSLAANLATDLLKAGARRLHAQAFGDAEQRALHDAWASAFGRMLADVAGGLELENRDLVGHIFRAFVQAEGVAEALLDLALEGREPPLALLRERFDQLETLDRATLEVDFDAALTALTGGLADALLAQAMRPESPLHTRVSVVRIAAIHRLLRDQHRELAEIAAAVARLEQALPAGARYNLVFLGPASGFAVGDEARVALAADLRPLLEQTLARLSEIAAPRQPPPYSEADRLLYLEAVEDACKHILLPYARQGEATLPLERIYVALRADRSSPVERRASRELFAQLVRERLSDRGVVDETILYRVAALDPYAARYRIYDPILRQALLKAVREAEERTYHLAELVRQQRWLVLLGHPGSGKSTLARWLALQLARAMRAGQAMVEVPADHVRPDGEPATRETLGPARLPVLVRIAEYAAGRWPRPGEDTRLPLRNYLGGHLEKQLAQGTRTAAFHALISDYLHAGRVTLILDGLDEVTDPDQRHAIAGEIEILIRKWVCDAQGRSPLDYKHALEGGAELLWQGNQLIVTSRIVGYQIRRLHENLPHFVIQPMDDSAVRRFCHNWASAKGMEPRADELVEAVLGHSNPYVREQMARNPLLLTILTQLFADTPEAGLPARRVALYERVKRAVSKQRPAQSGLLLQTADWATAKLVASRLRSGSHPLILFNNSFLAFVA